MFALAAAVLFVIAAFTLSTSQPWFWGFLGLAAWALHSVFAIALPRYPRA
jgi:hypothetical protein